MSDGVGVSHELADSGAGPGGNLVRQLDSFLSQERSLDVLVSTALGVLLLTELYGNVSSLCLFAWFGSVVAMGLAVYGVGRHYRRSGAVPGRPRSCGAALTGLTVAQGLLWGAVLLFLPLPQAGIDGDVGVYALTVIGLLGALSYAAFPPAVIGFVLALSLALGSWCLVSEGDRLFPGLLGVILPVGAAVWAGLYSRRLRQHQPVQESEDPAAELSIALAQAEAALDWVADGIVAVDRDGKVRRLNAAAEQLTGWSAEAARGRPASDVLALFEDGTHAEVPDAVAHCLATGEPTRLAHGEVMLRDRRSDQRATAVEVAVHPVRGDGGAVAVLRDVAELRGMARTMSYHANHDTLTGLLNRREFDARLWQAVEDVRHGLGAHTLVYLDLDQFKLVNDTCGHLAGDELLKDIGELIVGCVGEQHVVARLGGDEFGLLFRGVGVDGALTRAELLNSRVREKRFAWGDKVFNITCSMGVVPVDLASTPVDLFAAADAACYVAKEQGRNRVQVAHTQDRDLVRHRDDMAWIGRIQRALDQGRVRLRFQRIMPLRNGLPTMAELLLTLVDESGDPVAPATFLPAAVRFGLMTAVDREVVRRVFKHVARADDNPMLRGIDLFSLNISGQSLSDPQFLDHCLEMLSTTRADPKRICFEITETAVIVNIERARIFIEALREYGCRFALDDFGSGVSSFGYLRSLPVDFLKIDGQFVRHIAHDPIDRSMVASINEVGHVMGVRTIAEFVENQQIRAELEELGLDYAQGYGVHRPQYLD